MDMTIEQATTPTTCPHGVKLKTGTYETETPCPDCKSDEEQIRAAEAQTVVPQSEERGLTSEPNLLAMQQEVHEDTIDEKLRYAIADAFGEKPEFSGRFCAICNNTTAHFRPRGKAPDYVKTVPWMCTPCYLPGGKLYKIVRCLMARQGEIAP